VKIDADRLVGISAMVVGFASLLVFAYQAQLMRQSQRASVLPYQELLPLWHQRTAIAYCAVRLDRHVDCGRHVSWRPDLEPVPAGRQTQARLRPVGLLDGADIEAVNIQLGVRRSDLEAQSTAW
jgi:hypothetical protein